MEVEKVINAIEKEGDNKRPAIVVGNSAPVLVQTANPAGRNAPSQSRTLNQVLETIDRRSESGDKSGFTLDYRKVDDAAPPAIKENSLSPEGNMVIPKRAPAESKSPGPPAAASKELPSRKSKTHQQESEEKVLEVKSEPSTASRRLPYEKKSTVHRKKPTEEELAKAFIQELRESEDVFFEDSYLD